MVTFLTELDAFRQPERFQAFLQACEADSRGRTGLEQCALDEAERLLSALQLATAVDVGVVAMQYTEAEQIKSAVFEARCHALKLGLKI